MSLSLEIFILGILSEGHSHPYEIKKTILKNLSDEENLKIKDGTLYYRFDTLLKKELIQKVEVVREANRPDKTMYAITDKGREVLKEDIYKSFKNFSNIKTVYSSILFLKHVDLQIVMFLVQEAIEKVKKQREQLINESAAEWWESRETEIDYGKKEDYHFVKNHFNETIDFNLAGLEKFLAFLKQKQ
ncbi:PadR family transcriptional regulator [Priestia endophytica]|jgi:DNA-binding PadR family transcriptional regulator|uniref:PadR family transcriptional regulator n=1 Tax=Priestia endophytica TaxID=135735 RepID=UPI000F52FCB6|nr:PadR family transcriptional regulator [Priestia endophytica]MED4072624.1 PadR family transcriptional regulator [Priestia endophytica]RPK09564.1 hypothetical protein FH5_04427 [Priestia endophytica]